MGNQEIQRLLAHLKAHDGPLAVVFALAGKAVFAVQVAGVGHVQAQRLHHRAALFQVECLVGVYILGKQLSGGGQFFHVAQAILNFLPVHLGHILVFFQQRGDQLLFVPARITAGDHVIGQVVHRVHRTAVYVQHDVVAIHLIGMDHSDLFSLSLRGPAHRAAAKNFKEKRRTAAVRPGDALSLSDQR